MCGDLFLSIIPGVARLKLVCAPLTRFLDLLLDLEDAVRWRGTGLVVVSILLWVIFPDVMILARIIYPLQRQ